MIQDFISILLAPVWIMVIAYTLWKLHQTSVSVEDYLPETRALQT